MHHGSLPNYHPSQGRVWSRAELRGVAAACARQGVLLVADEIWADWVLPAAALAEGGDGVPAKGGEGGEGGVGAPAEGGERFVPCSAVAAAEANGSQPPIDTESYTNRIRFNRE